MAVASHYGAFRTSAWCFDEKSTDDQKLMYSVSRTSKFKRIKMIVPRFRSFAVGEAVTAVKIVGVRVKVGDFVKSNSILSSTVVTKQTDGKEVRRFILAHKSGRINAIHPSFQVGSIIDVHPSFTDKHWFFIVK